MIAWLRFYFLLLLVSVQMKGGASATHTHIYIYSSRSPLCHNRAQRYLQRVTFEEEIVRYHSLLHTVLRAPSASRGFQEAL